MFTPRYHNEQTDLLMDALLQLKTSEEAYRFLEVAVMLRRKVTYQEIAHQTGASTATISRVNRALQYGADGYTLVLDRLEAQQK